MHRIHENVHPALRLPARKRCRSTANECVLFLAARKVVVGGRSPTLPSYNPCCSAAPKTDERITISLDEAPHNSGSSGSRIASCATVGASTSTACRVRRNLRRRLAALLSAPAQPGRLLPVLGVTFFSARRRARRRCPLCGGAPVRARCGREPGAGAWAELCDSWPPPMRAGLDEVRRPRYARACCSRGPAPTGAEARPARRRARRRGRPTAVAAGGGPAPGCRPRGPLGRSWRSWSRGFGIRRFSASGMFGVRSVVSPRTLQAPGAHPARTCFGLAAPVKIFGCAG